MNRSIASISVSIAVVLVCPAWAGETLAKRIETLIQGEETRHAQWGLLVVNAETGAVVYEHNADQLFAPASVTKLYSCAAALIALGPDHRFETTVRQRGQIDEGVLKGDLILVAGGDLTFGGRRSADGRTLYKDKDHTYANTGLAEAELTDTDPLAALKELARQIKAAGVKEIQGEICVDDRMFAKSRGSGSGPDLVTPMLVNDNVVDVIISPGPREGDPAQVRLRPDTEFFNVDAVVTTTDADKKEEIHLFPLTPYRFALRGTIPLKSAPLVRIFPVEDPAGFARTLLIERLKAEGIIVQAAVVRPMPPELPPRGEVEKLPIVARYQSEPFRDVIRVTLKVSHNLYASILPVLVGWRFGKETVEAGMREQGRILKELGLDVQSISFGGGAGGARSDFVTPRATVQLLRLMMKRPEWPVYREALPVLGVDGTLSDIVEPSSPARGHVFAKTGTLYWLDLMNQRYLLISKALAGVVTTKAGTPLVFAVFVNHNPLPEGVTPTREGKTLAKIAEILWEFGP